MRKRILSILLAALMLVSLLPTMAFATEPAEISYLDEDGKTQTTSEYTEINAQNIPTSWSGVYFVSGELTIDTHIELAGDTTLILAEGTEFECDAGVDAKSYTLTVYGQNNNEYGNSCSLTIYGKAGDDGTACADGTNSDSVGFQGKLIVNSGNVDIQGGNGGEGGDGDTAGKGGEGCTGITGDVIVNGGNAQFYGGSGGEGGKGTCGGDGGNAAVGIQGTLTVNGGVVTCHGGDGGGGGEYNNGGTGGKSGEGNHALVGALTVNGGEVEVTGGFSEAGGGHGSGAAGTGGDSNNGANGVVGSVTMNDGVLLVQGGLARTGGQASGSGTGGKSGNGGDALKIASAADFVFRGGSLELQKGDSVSYCNKAGNKGKLLSNDNYGILPAKDDVYSFEVSTDDEDSYIAWNGTDDLSTFI